MPLGQAIEAIDPFVQPFVVPYCTFFLKIDILIKWSRNKRITAIRLSEDKQHRVNSHPIEFICKTFSID